MAQDDKTNDETTTTPAEVPAADRAATADINVPADATTSHADAPAGGTGVPNTDAGSQFGETPTPIPAEFAVKAASDDTGVRALPRTDSGYLQPEPTITGTHRVVVDTAPPANAPQAQTAAATRVANVGPGGLVELARLVYGNADRALDIFDANKDRLVSPDSVLVGQLLRIPD